VDPAQAARQGCVQPSLAEVFFIRPGQFADANNPFRSLAAPRQFIGMDCVEVTPAYTHAELTSVAAATAV